MIYEVIKTLIAAVILVAVVYVVVPKTIVLQVHGDVVIDQTGGWRKGKANETH